MGPCGALHPGGRPAARVDPRGRHALLEASASPGSEGPGLGLGLGFGFGFGLGLGLRLGLAFWRHTSPARAAWG
jgi:hypothetical protein